MTDLAQVLDATDLIMMKLKAALDLPGVNMIPYVNTASSVIGAVHAAYDAGKDIKPYLDNIKSTFGVDGIPSAAAMKALDDKIAALRAQVHAPMPEREGDEPE